MNNKLRFSSPSVLPTDTCPIRMNHFVQNLPYMALATRVLGTEAAAADWMCTPAPALGQQRPADMLLVDPLRVQRLLIQLEQDAQTSR